MSEKLGSAVLELTTDDRELDKGIGRAETKSDKLAASFERKGKRAQQIGGRLSLAVTAPIIAMSVTSVNAHRTQEKAIAGVEAALESMGDGAGYTSAQLQKMASDFQANSLFGDEDILNGVTANLLTFGNIADEEFSRASQLSLDLSARLGTDLQSSAIMLGKALNDPVTGLSALSRVGITFSEQQKEQIKAMAEAGDVAGAQALMLSELEKQYAGQAAAAAEADGGVIQLKNTWGDIQEEFGGVIAEILPSLTGGLSDLAGWLQSLDDDTKKWVVGIGLAAAAVGPLLVVFGFLASGIGSIMALIGPLTVAAGGAGLGAAFGAALAAAAPFVAVIAALVAAFVLFGDKIGPVLSALQEKFQEVLGPKLQGLFNTVKTTLTELWEGPFGDVLRVVIDKLGDFGAASTSVLGEVLLRILSALVTAVENAFTLIGNVLTVVGALLTGDFAGAWAAAQTLVGDAVAGMLAFLNSLAPEAVQAVQSLVANMIQMGRDVVSGLVNGIKANANAVWNAIKGVVTGGINAAKKLLGIASPSKVFAQIGAWVSEGMAEGIISRYGMVESALAGMSKSAQEFAVDVTRILDKAFPEMARYNQLQIERAALDKAVADGILDENKALEAKFRLTQQFSGSTGAGSIRSSTINQGSLSLPDVKASQLPDLSEAVEGQAPAITATWERTFSDGLKAALDGDLGGFFRNFLDNMVGSLIDGLGQGLGGLLGGGGEAGGIFGLILSFAGGFYTGGTIPTGQFGLVGERGPELAFSTPRGALIRPNSSLSSSSLRGPSANISMPISIDATGADAAALSRVQDSVDQLREEIPGKIIGTVQDAGERGIIRAGNWR